MQDVGLRAMMEEADTSRNGSLDIQEFTFLITQVSLEIVLAAQRGVAGKTH